MTSIIHTPPLGLNNTLVRVWVYVVGVLILTRMMKSVVTGQAPVTLEWQNAHGKKSMPNVVRAHVIM